MSTDKDAFMFDATQSMANDAALNSISEATSKAGFEIRNFQSRLLSLRITGPMPEKKHPLNKNQVKSRSRARAAKQARKRSR